LVQQTLTHRFGVPFWLPGWVTSLVPVWVTGLGAELGDQGWLPVWVPSLGKRFGLLFPSVSRSCRLTRTVLDWYNTHTQVWCPILAAWLGDQFGYRLGDQFGCQVWVSGLACYSQACRVPGVLLGKWWLGTTLTHRFGLPFRLPGWVTSLVPVWLPGQFVCVAIV
jgi:hypothetical protein